MGKLKVIASAPVERVKVKPTKVGKGENARRQVGLVIKRVARFDENDARYELVDGKRRRRADSFGPKPKPAPHGRWNSWL